MFEMLPNGQVLRMEEITTKKQTVIVKSHHCMEKRVLAEVSKAQLALGEEIVVSFKWQKFDIESEHYVDDSSNRENFQVDIAGIQEIIPPINGAGQIIFSSDEPGEFIIKTVNPNVDNAQIKVVVS